MGAFASCVPGTGAADKVGSSFAAWCAYSRCCNARHPRPLSWLDFQRYGSHWLPHLAPPRRAVISTHYVGIKKGDSHSSVSTGARSSSPPRTGVLLPTVIAGIAAGRRGRQCQRSAGRGRRADTPRRCAYARARSGEDRNCPRSAVRFLVYRFPHLAAFYRRGPSWSAVWCATPTTRTRAPSSPAALRSSACRTQRTPRPSRAPSPAATASSWRASTGAVSAPTT